MNISVHPSPWDDPGYNEFALISVMSITDLTLRLVQEHGCSVADAYASHPDDGVLRALVRYYEIVEG